MKGYLRPVIVVVAVSSLLALAVTLVPSAEVLISPQIQRQEFQFSLQLDPDLEDTLMDERIPALTIGTQVSDSLRFPTSGQVTVPSSAAQGSVIFTNLTSDSVTVPVGTGLRASSKDNLRFVTTESVVVQAGKGRQVLVTIEADFLGPKGNLPSGAIDAVEGTLGFQLAVQNEDATKGGANELRSAVGVSDLRLLEEELTKSLLNMAEEELSTGKDTDEILVPGTLRVVEVLDRSYDREVGAPADTLSLTLNLEISGSAYRVDDVESGAHAALISATSDEVRSIPGSFRYEITGTEITDVGEIHVKGIAWQEVYQPLDEVLIRDLLRAQAPQHAERLLKQSLELDEDPIVKSFPSWLPRLPWLPQRISIRYIWEGSE